MVRNEKFDSGLMAAEIELQIQLDDIPDYEWDELDREQAEKWAMDRSDEHESYYDRTEADIARAEEEQARRIRALHESLHEPD